MSLRKSLYARLFVPFATLLVAAMGSAAWISSHLFTAALEDRLDEQLDRATAEFSQGIIPLTPDLLARAASLIQADLAFFDSSGALAMSTMSAPQARDVGGLAALLAETDAGTPVIATDFRGFRVVLRRMSRDPRYSAVAAIASTDDLRRASRDAALGFGIAAAVATLVLGLAASYLVRSIVGPVASLSRMAGRIAEGDRDVEVDIQRSDEIGSLTRALNEMSRRLGAYEAELSSQARLSALGEMAARIAHEIRNPLTAIKLKLQLLEEAAGSGSAEDFRSLLREIERLDFVVTSTLTVARPQSINATPTDLNAVIDDVVSLTEAQLAHQNIACEVSRGDLPLAPLDEARIKQIVFNLIHNAANAMPDGGRLRISTRSLPEAGRVRIDIEDSGPGIEIDQLDSLFSPERGSGAFKLGLGLSLCRELTELHGGTISAGRSEELGGAHFSIELPSL